MSETAKRKGPPTKADLIERATKMGHGRPGEMQQLTAKQIREIINQLKAEPTPEKEPGTEDPAIPGIREPNCGHIFREVRELHRNGNIIVKICNICGWRETVG